MNLFKTIRKTAGSIVMFSMLNIAAGFAQKPVDKMTKEDVMAMSYGQLADLSLEDLMKLANIVGVSIDDLFNMVLNRDVSIASKSSESSFDTPLSTSILSAEDITRAGVLSIPEALRLIPGIIVREKTNGNYDVHIRGNDNIPYGNYTVFSENTLTLVMVDGRPVYNYATGGTFWESLPVGLHDVERIEVVRGPASALYGANAVTGVINIITKRAASKKPSVEAAIQSGNRFAKPPSSMAVSGTQNLAISFGLNDKLKFRLSGNYDYRDRAQEEIYMWKSETTPDLLQNGYYSPESVDLVDRTKTAEDMYDDYSLGLDAFSVNAGAQYAPSTDVNADFSIGTQRSIAISSNTDNGNVAHTTRLMDTRYTNLNVLAHGFNLQASYMWGYEDLEMGWSGEQFDFYNLYLNADYNFRLFDNKISVRPGISYARSMLNDLPYHDEGENAYLNGKKFLASYAPSIRADWSPLARLRFVGAFRYEKNIVPDKGYPTWQLIANYKLHESSSVRAVYSRANRSPFMLDTRSDAAIEFHYGELRHSSDPSDPKNRLLFKLNGNPDIKLATMDMLELGYRRKLFQRVLINIEAFYTYLKNPSAGVLTELKYTLSHVPGASVPIYPYERSQTFSNLEETSQQYGLTAEAGIVFNKSVNMRLFGTVQHTILNNHDNLTLTQKMIRAAEKLGADPSKLSDDMTVTDIPVELINTTSKATPALYGGYELNWLPFDSWTISSTGYGFTRQTYINYFDKTDIEPKLLVNMRVAYKFSRQNSISLNVNNIFNATSKEFGFMDKTGMHWYFGLHVKF